MRRALVCLAALYLSAPALPVALAQPGAQVQTISAEIERRHDAALSAWSAP